MTDFYGSILALLLLAIQVPAVAILWSRLIRGPQRPAPLLPRCSELANLGRVSVVVPTLNEAQRLGPCLRGLSAQSYEVREILVVDSRSQDGTPELVKAAATRDPRYRLITDDPLPPGWVGRPWALHTGFLHSATASDWVLGIDADTQPQPGLVASLLHTAQTRGYDLVSLSPRFILKAAGEWWLQPALLMTLIYRFGPGGTNSPERTMANGQCFLIRRSLLEKLAGYSSARNSFCDDVTLARQAAQQGANVAFLDGSQVLKVRMYEGLAETWREWGRSLDLQDATTVAQKWGDLGVLLAVQGLPPLVTLGFAGWWVLNPGFATLLNLSLPLKICLGLNLVLVLSRWAMLLAIRPAYNWPATGSWGFWLSPLADPLAVIRILLSSLRRPKQWRGRVYG